MGNLHILLVVLATRLAQAAMPQYEYTITYNAPKIPLFDGDDQPVLDESGAPVLQSVESNTINMYGGGSCIRPLAGAIKLVVSKLPPDGPAELGWIMYPGSAACNADKGTLQGTEVALTLEQAEWGWNQNYPPYDQGMPVPISFRLFFPDYNKVAPAGTKTTLSWFQVGRDDEIPSGPSPEDIDLLIPPTRLDANTKIGSQYASEGWRIFQTDRYDSQPTRGLLNAPYDPAGYPINRAPPGYYESLQNRMQLFWPILILDRFAKDIENDELVLEAIDSIELSKFITTFLGRPITPPGVSPLRFMWPDPVLVHELSKLTGFAMPVDSTGEPGYYSPLGHTVAEALDISRVLARPLRAWSAAQPLSTIQSWGSPRPDQAAAEKWLIRLQADSIFKRPAIQSPQNTEVIEELIDPELLPENINPALTGEVIPGGNQEQIPARPDADVSQINIRPEDIEFDEAEFEDALSNVGNLDISGISRPGTVLDLDPQDQRQLQEGNILDTSLLVQQPNPELLQSENANPGNLPIIQPGLVENPVVGNPVIQNPVGIQPELTESIVVGPENPMVGNLINLNAQNQAGQPDLTQSLGGAPNNNLAQSLGTYMMRTMGYNNQNIPLPDTADLAYYVPQYNPFLALRGRTGRPNLASSLQQPPTSREQTPTRGGGRRRSPGPG
ncbi:hypothetical protein DRE_06694 [Drechslerella stenobrocha 248]|uniref:Uncharacterized protein n=1 Tax=Drechslerella stenobrocha 248 TaxID=1043628 RepID=W7HWS8_9PEZI|nr:hypothetical protein DRE_06694 [Drechslerella stenobrocha 248]